MYLVSEFQFLVPLFMLYRMHGRYGGLPSWRNPAKHPTSPHGSMAAGDCSDAAVQGLCAGRGMVEARGRSCWGTAGAHRSKQRSYVRLRRNTGPKATRHPAWECWRTGKPKSRESPCVVGVRVIVRTVYRHWGCLDVMIRNYDVQRRSFARTPCPSRQTAKNHVRLSTKLLVPAVSLSARVGTGTLHPT